MAPKQVLVIYLGVISLYSQYQLSRSSNDFQIFLYPTSIIYPQIFTLYNGLWKLHNEIIHSNNLETSGRGQLKGPALNSQKLKIDTMAPKQVLVIYLGVISLDSKFQLSGSSNVTDMDKSFSSNFCHKEGGGTIFKYLVILG